MTTKHRLIKMDRTYPTYIYLFIRMFHQTTICRGDNHTGKNFVQPKDYISGCVNFSFNCQSVSLLQAYLLLELSSSSLLAGTGGNRWQPVETGGNQRQPAATSGNRPFGIECQLCGATHKNRKNRRQEKSPLKITP